MERPQVEGILGIPEKSNVPEGVGQSEDSGFASIGGSVATEYPESVPDDRPGTSTATLIPYKWSKEVQREERRAAQQRYENEKREKAYKRLMHLLTQSKFFADFLVQKLNNNTPSKLPANRKRKQEESRDEDYSPPKKARRGRAKKDALKEVLPESLKKKVSKKDKLNLSEEDIEAELNAAMPNEEEEEEPEAVKDTFVQPKYFIGELRDYQKVGLQWLRALYENGMSGILADEMGLGKTIQVIAMMAHLIEKQQPGPYLIIAPLSTIPNWLAEFERFAPQIPVHLYYGPKAERPKLVPKMKKMHTVDGFRTQPVVITTYETPIADVSLMQRQNWRYIIVDEGQRIKNPETQLSKILHACKSMNRLLLTGTPLQNDLKELWSLLNFLMPELFDDLAVFESWFNAKDLQSEQGTKDFLQQEEERNIVQSLREILKPFMLRRLKDDVCLDIPPKKEVMVYCPMSKLQHDLYSAYLKRDIAALYRTKFEPVILDDEFGRRPKRRCAVNNKYSGVYRDPYNISGRQLSDSPLSSSSASRASSPDPDYVVSPSSSFLDSPAAKEARREPQPPPSDATLHDVMKDWKDHVEVNDDNRLYLFRMTFGMSVAMYKKIVNHPYLIHLPLDDVGLPKIDEELITASGKFAILDKMLQKLHADGHKVLLFSTMTMILDVIEDYLLMRPWKYVRLDGSVKIEQRKEDIQLFNSDPSYFLFLISTRAGGVGLNLAGADTVIIFDSDWNPQADIQAMARCHRIGQVKPVVIYRLCTKGSFDEAIVSRAEAKRKLEKLVISKAVEGISVKTKEGLMELKKLLDSSDQEVAASGDDGGVTEEELKKILDRNDLVAKWKKSGANDKAA